MNTFKNVFVIFVLIIILGSALFFVFKPKSLVTSLSSQKTAKIIYAPGTDYEVATLRDGTSAQSDVYLKGRTQDPQKAIVYVKKAKNTNEFPTREGPLTIGIFEKVNGGYENKVFFSGDGEQLANEYHGMQILPDFFQTGKDVLLVVRTSTGYGSGYTDYLTFIGYYGNPPSAPQDPSMDKYRILNGPVLSELDKFKIEGKYGSVLVAEAFYSDDYTVETHFDPHRYEFFRYDWNYDSFLKSGSLGKTSNKYGVDVTIDEMIKAEDLKVGRTDN